MKYSRWRCRLLTGGGGTSQTQTFYFINNFLHSSNFSNKIYIRTNIGDKLEIQPPNIIFIGFLVSHFQIFSSFLCSTKNYRRLFRTHLTLGYYNFSELANYYLEIACHKLICRRTNTPHVWKNEIKLYYTNTWHERFNR